MNSPSPLTQPATDHALASDPENRELPQTARTAPASDETNLPKMADTIRTSLEPTKVKKDYALITGASSGIGEAFARLFASKNKPLILIAQNEDKLKTLAAELREKHNVDVRFIASNLARSKTLPELPGKLKRMGITVDILVNNAGFGKYEAEHKIRYEDSLNMVNLNCRTLLGLTKLFLPEMLARKKGAIINIASAAGFFPVPYMATYAASKAFVINFSEALAEEVKDKGVRVVCACPGATSTNFQKRAGINASEHRDLMQLSDPFTVAEQTIEALKNGKVLAIVGKTSFITKYAPLFAPRNILARIGKRLMNPKA
ncbi:SDR family NAD(P)-dependent oxidoreductase [Candidatus Uhrbacteria bacterium]|nr:SDR family NAD(P)-dependent oxidoreductase [Candidatus Uhrbacteria bacterium]